ASSEETAKRIMAAFTDPARKYRHDAGHPDVCNIYSLHRAVYCAKLEEIASDCRSAALGCVDCKRLLAKELNDALAPMRERRRELETRPEYVAEVLEEGARRASAIAQETIREVKENMGLAWIRHQ
ncbi:MAG: tryptophan--tRNA ligase, partial [Chloroflexi bacterium]|nr:tryptophan--tRNA ligase [Chloroflexota bacterium]